MVIKSTFQHFFRLNLCKNDKMLGLRNNWRTHSSLPPCSIGTSNLPTSHIKRDQRRKCAATSCLRPRSGEGRKEAARQRADRGSSDWWEWGDERGNVPVKPWSIRCKGWKDEKHKGLRFTGQLKLSCFVVIFMQHDRWLLQLLLFIFFIFSALELVFSYSSPSCNSASHLSTSHSEPFYRLFLPPTVFVIMQLHPALVFLAPAASAACDLIRPISW